MHYFIRALKNSINFSDRDSRKQYWMYMLIRTIIRLVLVMAKAYVLGNFAGQILLVIFGLVVFFPDISTSVRRLHDIGNSGWWALLWLVPVVGWIWIIDLLCKPGHLSDNQYGAVPEE